MVAVRAVVCHQVYYGLCKVLSIGQQSSLHATNTKPDPNYTLTVGDQAIN